jgi:hypothetical protein
MTGSSDLPDEPEKEEVARSRKFALNRETLRATGTGKFRGYFSIAWRICDDPISTTA